MCWEVCLGHFGWCSCGFVVVVGRACLLGEAGDDQVSKSGEHDGQVLLAVLLSFVLAVSDLYVVAARKRN